MRRFGRRSSAEISGELEVESGNRVEAETLAGPVAAPEDRSGGLFRVAEAWHLEGHPSSVPAHVGPAYNEAFAETVAHVKGIAVGDVDLLAEAQLAAERRRAEVGEGWVVWVERLRQNAAGDAGEWERVS
jgi:hypothetical protein